MVFLTFRTSHYNFVNLAVDPEKSQFKQKSGDQLLVMLKKAKENDKWESLLKLEKKEHKFVF
jgi:hypothetical protein